MKSRSFGEAKNRVFISPKAHLILPCHELIDKARESDEKNAIGTTCKGIERAYTDKVGRVGFRVGDLCDIERFLARLKTRWNSLQVANLPNFSDVEVEIRNYAKQLKPFIKDTNAILWEAIESNKRILLEGAQGSMLDIDHGTYPFVTSSTTLTAGACSGSGIAPKDIGEVIGIAKAYCTRVGQRTISKRRFRRGQREITAKRCWIWRDFTGRVRRCGWFDAVAAKYTIRLNGVSKIAIMKLDVLDDLPENQSLRGLSRDGAKIADCENFSYPFNLEGIKPIYREFEGFSGVAGVREFDKLPQKAKDYILALEGILGVKISIISTSPDRNDTINR